MKPLKCKRIMILLISLVLILAFGVMNSIAQEKMKRSDKRYWLTIKMEVMKVDDTEGHVIIIQQQKGVDVGSGAIYLSTAFLDLVKGNGTILSYSKGMTPNGVNYSTAEGKITSTLSPAGKPIPTAQGTFTMTKGTGVFEGQQGSGTWKSRGIGEGVSVMEWEGEFTKK